ncbi:AgmX/PglI C-terminal domain-containing protein [Marinobacteraceae bacterium S3BR75-40.1]
MAELRLRSLALPWSREPGDQLRFGIVFGLLLVVFLPLALWIPRIDLPEPQQEELEEVPPQLAQLLPEPEKVEPPPPAPKEEPEPEPEPEPESEPEPEQEPEPQPEPETAPEPTPEPQPQETVQEAREKASKSGLLALKDELADMRSLTQTEAPEQIETISADADKASSVLDATSKAEATAGSGGLKGRPDGPREEVALQDRETQRLAAAAKTAEQPKAAKGDAGPRVRSMGNIRATFDRNKASLFALYNRAWRRNPGLEGTLLLKVVIEPDGSVSDVEVVSSELGTPDLEQKIAMRVRLFDFGRKDVKQRTVEFPVTFLPPS